MCRRVLSETDGSNGRGAAHGDGKEEWNSDSGATFHMSHTRTGMTAYKKASPGTSVEVADGTILPVDGFGTIEMDLDQPGSRRGCARTFAEPAVHLQSSEAKGEAARLLQGKGCFGVPGGGNAHF